jgi:hypothetical protein
LKEKVTRPLASGRNARRAGEQPGVNAQKRNRGKQTPAYAQTLHNSEAGQ